MAVLVQKADGLREAFDPQKLLHSLEHAGAEPDTAKKIAARVEGELYDGITTQEIYRHAFAQLRAARHGAAARYSLKRAVMDFGPSGFPFEAYIAELFRAEGSTAVIDQLVGGACVEHEVDVVSRKGGDTTYTEAKFHNAAGFKTDLKTALYVKARMDDIRAAHPGQEAHIFGLLVTNTKFTSHAIRYAECSGVDLLSWEYPRGKTLHERIDAVGLYPVTALTMLSRREKTALLQQKIVLCNVLPNDTRSLAEAGVTGHKAQAVLEEVGALCIPGTHR